MVEEAGRERENLIKRPTCGEKGENPPQSGYIFGTFKFGDATLFETLHAHPESLILGFLHITRQNHSELVNIELNQR